MLTLIAALASVTLLAPPAKKLPKIVIEDELKVCAIPLKEIRAGSGKRIDPLAKPAAPVIIDPIARPAPVRACGQPAR